MSCLASLMYIFNVDVHTQDTVINPDTNETERTWKYLKTIRAYVFPYLEGGLRGMGTSESFGDRYINSDYLRVKTSEELDKRWRITNIRNAETGKVIYQEHVNGDPTIYNVDGSIPVVNPLSGEIDEWVTSISRAEIQA